MNQVQLKELGQVFGNVVVFDEVTEIEDGAELILGHELGILNRCVENRNWLDAYSYATRILEILKDKIATM